MEEKSLCAIGALKHQQPPTTCDNVSNEVSNKATIYVRTKQNEPLHPGGGGRREGVLPYISHIGNVCNRVGFLRRFGLKMGIHFVHFGLESGMVLEGTKECMDVFIVSIPNK